MKISFISHSDVMNLCTLCLKNDTALAGYNFYVHEPILIIFGGIVAKKVSSLLYFQTCDSMVVVGSIPDCRTIGQLVLGWVTVFRLAYRIGMQPAS